MILSLISRYLITLCCVLTNCLIHVFNKSPQIPLKESWKKYTSRQADLKGHQNIQLITFRLTSSYLLQFVSFHLYSHQYYPSQGKQTIYSLSVFLMFRILYRYFLPIFTKIIMKKTQNLPDKQYADHSLKQSPSLLFVGQQKYLKYQLEKVKKKELPNQGVLDDIYFLVWEWGQGNNGSNVKNKTKYCLLAFCN